MVEKPYDWTNGARLYDHTRQKHKILRQYLAEYLTIRCQLPQQKLFRLAIIDGFAGGGKYMCGAPGSPIIFLDELFNASSRINAKREADGRSKIVFHCLLILNDRDPDAVSELKSNTRPFVSHITSIEPSLHIDIEYMNEPFDSAYEKIKRLLEIKRYQNVLFNLDQCGHSHVDRRTLTDIMRICQSVEVFYTFAIQSLISFMQRNDQEALTRRLSYLDIDLSKLDPKSGIMSKDKWLGTAEKLVFDAFRNCAPYVSPFSIRNPGGWQYWLVHFANRYRARQAYNNVLHQNSSSQAHYGRSGLNMLSYNPRHEGVLYLFEPHDREAAIQQLIRDIPNKIAECGDTILASQFYENIYNSTPAHADDIHQAMISCPDIEVITPNGGERRKANSIIGDDIIQLRPQASFFSMFSNATIPGQSDG